MLLSAHFSLEELTFSETASRLAIDNTPDDGELQNLALLCEEILEPLREKVGPIRVTSGFRCLPLNRRIGSRDTSHHTMGRAADIQVPGMKPLDVCKAVVELGLPFEQCIHEYGSWCHVAIAADGAAPKRQCLTIDKQGTRPGLHPVR